MPHETAIAGQGGAWAPPANLAAWWYANADVAAGSNWIDQIAGYTLLVPAGCNVTAGTGLIEPITKAAGSITNYTPQYGAAGVGSTLSMWVRLNAAGSNVTGRLLGSANTSNAGSLFVRETRQARASAYFGVLFNGSVLNLGQWYHLALAQYWGDDAGQTNKAAIYCEGGLQIGTPVVGVGGTVGVVRLNFNASVQQAIDFDDIMWYTRALSQPEIADIVANSPGRH